MNLSNMLALFAVLLYTLKQGNCALQKQNDDDTKEKGDEGTGNIYLMMMTHFSQFHLNFLIHGNPLNIYSHVKVFLSL